MVENRMKKILITGSNSYIGNSFEEYLRHRADSSQYEIHKISLRDEGWRNISWRDYDTILHVAGIAHVDVKKASEETKRKYYQINRDLTVTIAEKARSEGVKQFIFLSSMIVFGNSGEICANTFPAPVNFYGDSKWQAEQQLRKMETQDFKVAIVRPPFVYGKDAKGNYPLLAKLSCMTPVFPAYRNQRSMIYVENLCEFLRLLIIQEKGGAYHPQNREVVSTTQLVDTISRERNHKIWFVSLFNWGIRMLGKRDGVVKKVFGSFFYDPAMSVYENMDYQIYGLEESIRRTEEK